MPRPHRRGPHLGAERYQVGDVLRYSRASKETGIGKSAYVQMKSIDAAEQPADSRTTVELQDGREQTYDPRRANFCWDGRNPAKFMLPERTPTTYT